jgi:hypothetical protein
MTRDQVVAAMTKWWESGDGWIEGDVRKRGIDHSLDWPTIVDKVLALVESDDK